MKKLICLLLCLTLMLSAAFIFTSCNDPQDPEDPENPDNPDTPVQPGPSQETDSCGGCGGGCGSCSGEAGQADAYLMLPVFGFIMVLILRKKRT